MNGTGASRPFTSSPERCGRDAGPGRINNIPGSLDENIQQGVTQWIAAHFF